MPNESQLNFGAISHNHNLLGYGLSAPHNLNQSYEVEFDSAEFELALIEEGNNSKNAQYQLSTNINDLKYLYKKQFQDQSRITV